MARILYIVPGYVPPPQDNQMNRYYHMSDDHCGVVLSPVWGKGKLFATGPVVKNFEYHVTHCAKFPKLLRKAWEVWFFIFMGLRLHYFRSRFDLIMSYGTNTTGLAAVLLRILTGAKLILEVPGTPATAFLYDNKRPGAFQRVKHRVSMIQFWIVLQFTNHLKLLSPGQLNGLPFAHDKPTSVFHNCVPISQLQASELVEPYILSLGHPWYLKGVDVLIQAFQRISDEFPDWRLKIVGHCPNREPFEKLRNGHARIEFLRGVPHPEAMEIMARSSLFVLPSRTEAMGRVLLEAMALRKPIVASRVDGIPHYLQDGENGLLFESEDIDDLAAKLRSVLADPSLAQRLATEGHRIVNERYSEVQYAEKFDHMVQQVVAPC